MQTIMISASQVIANALETSLQDPELLKLLTSDGEITTIARELQQFTQRGIHFSKMSKPTLPEICLNELLKSVLWIDVANLLRKSLLNEKNTLSCWTFHSRKGRATKALVKDW